MHEVSLVQALFDHVDRAISPHSGASVRQVSVRVGELSGVECICFRSAFDGCKGERGYANAALEIMAEAAVWRCGDCGAAVQGAGPLRCARCDGVPHLAAGGDLVLQRLELETEDV
jgi:Zn finger protein HypA/HybF involved in hydrogenase expression